MRDSPETTIDVLLELPPDRLVSLSVHPPSDPDQSEHPTPASTSKAPASHDVSDKSLRIVLAASGGVIIAPLALQTLHPTTLHDAQVLETLRRLSQSRAIVVHPLPPTTDHADSRIQLLALCDAIASIEDRLVYSNGAGAPPGHLQVDLNTLYHGKGGRIVASDEAFGNPVTIDDNDNGATTSPAPVVMEECPPLYTEVVDAKPSRKRPRRTSSSDEDSQRGGATMLDHNAEKGKMIMRDAATFEVGSQVAEMIKTLNASIAAAAAMDAQLRTTMLEAAEAQQQRALTNTNPTHQVRATSEATTTASSAATTNHETRSQASSVPECISDRLRTYLDHRLEQVQDDMRGYYNARLEQRLEESLADYSSIEHTEQHVREEVELLTAECIDEGQMWDAIQEAVERVEQDIRTRILDAWS